MSRRWGGMPPRWSAELRSLLDFLPLILGAILIVLAATATGSVSTHCLFQSPVSPAPISPIEAPAVPSPLMPRETAVSPTVTGPVLKAVPATPNLVPWIIGLLVIIIVVGVVLYLRGGREGGGGTA